MNSGGAPIPQGTGQTCYTLPNYDQYNVNFLHCYYPSTGTTTTLVCYG